MSVLRWLGRYFDPVSLVATGFCVVPTYYLWDAANAPWWVLLLAVVCNICGQVLEGLRSEAEALAREQP